MPCPVLEGDDLNIIIDVQKKVSRLLGIAPSDDEAES
jgi:hypothetical protein